MLAITYTKIMKIKKIKVAHWGTPKKYLKKQNNLVDASKYIKFQINIKVKHNFDQVNFGQTTPCR